MIWISTLEAQGHSLTHLSINETVLSEVLPTARPTCITREIHRRGISPRHGAGTSLVSRNLCRPTCYLPIKSSSHVDILRHKRSIGCIGNTMILIHAKDRRNAQMLDRGILYLLDISAPLCRGNSLRAWSIKERADTEIHNK